MDNNREPLILAVETATRAGSVSLAMGAKTLSSLAGDPAASHSSNLIYHIDELLRGSGRNLSEVDLFAATLGPGSFTGLRIGLATIKGLAASLNRRCVGIPTLAAIAHSSGPSVRTVALLPAGRGELFGQLFSVAEMGGVEAIDDAVHLGPDAVFEKYGGLRALTWAGEGSQVHADRLREWAAQSGIAFVEPYAQSDRSPTGSNDQWSLAAPCEKLAESVLALALKAYELGKSISPEELRAIYVRPSDAEMNIQCQK